MATRGRSDDMPEAVHGSHIVDQDRAIVLEQEADRVRLRVPSLPTVVTQTVCSSRSRRRTRPPKAVSASEGALPAMRCNLPAGRAVAGPGAGPVP
jgi:hypothetical protein